MCTVRVAATVVHARFTFDNYPESLRTNGIRGSYINWYLVLYA